MTILLLFLFLIANANLLFLKDYLREGNTYLFKQVIFSLLSILLYFTIKNYNNPKKLFNFFNIFFAFNLFLMIIAFFAPYKIRATRRWIDLYLFSVQPGELLKLTLPIFFVTNLYTNKFFHHSGLMIIVLFADTLLLLQPNLSNAIILFAGILSVFFLNPFLDGKRKLYIFIFLASVFVSILRFNLKPYHFERIKSFFETTKYEQTSAYQPFLVRKILSCITLTGIKDKENAIKYFKLLPEKHNDFAFISLIFKFGKISGLIVIFIYLLLAIVIIDKIFRVDSKVIQLLIISYLMIFLIQTICSIAVNLTLFPVAGITLPFLSYGGSSFLTFTIMLAIINNRYLPKTKFLYE